MEKSNYKIIEMIPSSDDYLALNCSVGWEKIPHGPSIEKALQNSLLCLCAMDGNKVVGFARVVGDLSICFYIQDLIVHPGYQRKGIGSSLMNSVIKFIKENAAAEAFVGLMAAVDTEPFYELYEFKRRPDTRPGMDMVMKKNSG
jgi:ribosomal protein S18 acetylase RimI-like enzyme